MGVKGSGIDKAIDDGVAWVENYIDLGTKELVSMVATGMLNIGKLLVNCIIGIIVSVYVLCSKEVFKGQTKKLLYGIFRVDYANVILEIGRKTRDIFYGFIIGKLIDSAIIGVILILFANKKIHDNPYLLILNCQDENAENTALSLMKEAVKKYAVKSKTVNAQGIEFTAEIRMKDGETAFVNRLNEIAGVENATLVSYNGEYMS